LQLQVIRTVSTRLAARCSDPTPLRPQTTAPRPHKGSHGDEGSGGGSVIDSGPGVN